MEPPPDDRPENNPLMHPPGTAEWERQNKEHGKWSKPTLAFAFVLFGVFVVAGLSVTVESAREGARKAACGCHGGGAVHFAIQHYESEHGTNPPPYLADDDGRRVHSWRALVLPYLDEELAKEYRFDEPWDGPNNSKLHHRMPKQFRCPSDSKAADGTTSYFAVVGDQTIWPSAGSRANDEVSDGISKTVQLVEAVGLNVNWLDPRDLEFATMDFHLNAGNGNSIGSAHPGGAYVWMADGSRRFFHNSIEPDLLKALLTVSGGEEVSPP